MKIMTGIDLHSNNALCGLMDESGRRLVHKKLPCELPAILQLLEPYKDHIATVAIESTYNWYWLADGWEIRNEKHRTFNPSSPILLRLGYRGQGLCRAGIQLRLTSRAGIERE